MLLGRRLLVNRVTAHGRRSCAASGFAAAVPRRCFASSDVQVKQQSDSGAVTDPGNESASQLAQLSERAGYLPRPDVHDETLKPGFRGGTKLFIFFLCNALPIGGALYWLRQQREERAQMSLLALPADADEVAAEALRVIRTSPVCFLLQPPDGAAVGTAGVGKGACGVLRVDPHVPEGTAFVPPTEPLPLVPQLERNVLTDLIESPPTAGLSYIHYALSRSSAPGQAALAGDRRGSLMYASHVRGAYCTIVGQVSILSDAESRRRYWKGAWSGSFVGAASPSAPRPSTPSAAARPAEEEQKAPPAWAHPDYLLVRLAVSEVTLQQLVDGPQRWDQRRARKLDDRVEKKTNADGEVAKWALMHSATGA